LTQTDCPPPPHKKKPTAPAPRPRPAGRNQKAQLFVAPQNGARSGKGPGDPARPAAESAISNRPNPPLPD